jgi:hypothetical protein
MDVWHRRAVDQQAAQFRATVVTASVHEPVAGIDLGEVEIGDHFAVHGRLKRYRCKTSPSSFTGPCKALCMIST